MKLLAAITLGVTLAGCATGQLGYFETSAGLCGRWVGYAFVTEPASAGAVDKLRGQP